MPIRGGRRRRRLRNIRLLLRRAERLAALRLRLWRSLLSELVRRLRQELAYLVPRQLELLIKKRLKREQMSTRRPKSLVLMLLSAGVWVFYLWARFWHQ